MTDEEKSQTWQVVKYLLQNGVQVIPLAPGKKYPTFNDWQNSTVDMRDLEKYIITGHGFGIKPNGDWCYIDLDGDHTDGVDGVINFFSAIPRKAAQTLYARKEGSKNLHLFYQNNLHTNLRATGDSALLPGVEFSARDSQVRINPAYVFQNLDLTKSFLEQLAPIPRQLEPALTPVVKPESYKTTKQRANNISAYLRKVSAFERGERSMQYRKLIFVMVVKWGMPYDEVKTAVDAWDLQNGAFQLDEPSQYEHATRPPEKN